MKYTVKFNQSLTTVNVWREDYLIRKGISLQDAICFLAESMLSYDYVEYWYIGGSGYVEMSKNDCELLAKTYKTQAEIPF